MCYFTFPDQDEEEGCGYLALWVLHEDRGWRSLDLQVGFFMLSVILLSNQNPGFDLSVVQFKTFLCYLSVNTLYYSGVLKAMYPPSRCSVSHLQSWMLCFDVNNFSQFKEC